MKNLLLAVIAVGVLVIAGVLVYDKAGIGEREHTDAWRSAHEDAERSAGYYCTLGGVVPGMTSLHDPAYKSCVKDETETRMEEWEGDFPHEVWK